MANSTNVIKKTLRGITKAQHAYEAWTYGYWLVDAPEYLTTTYIAKEIATSTDHFVTLEQDAKESIKEAGGPGSGKLAERVRRKLDGGRFDIVVWDDDTPIIIIEVKKQPNVFGKIEGDVGNICRVLKGKNSLQYGLIAYCSAWRESEDESAEERTSRIVEDIKSDAEVHIKKKRGLKLIQYLSLSKTKVVDEYKWAWIAVVLKISKA